MKNKKLCRSRSIHDNVHKLIPLSQEEMDVIDHPIYQRLRDIRQTGLLRYVTPSANHTRFEHGLGTMHMAQAMLDALVKGSTAAESKLFSMAEATDGQSVCFHQLELKTRKRLERLTRLTALVHDLGHGPLSHVFDTFAPKVEDIEPLLDDPRLDAIRPLGVRLTAGKDGHVRHEAVSCILFAALWHDLDGPAWIPEAVSMVLLNQDPTYGDTKVPVELHPWIPFVRDLVSSAPIDADRMDYLRRDSKALGVSYGLYEPDRILKAILCVRTTNAYRLGWRYSSMRAIEDFVDARFKMFAQIYSHKTLRCTELMLKKIERDASKEDKCLVRGGKLDDFIEDYLELSDESFLKRLTNIRGSNIATLARDLKNRWLWKRLYEYRRQELPFAEAHLAEMQRRHPDRIFILDRLPIKAMKDLERGALLMEIGPRGKYVRCADTDSWIEASPDMKTKLEQEQATVRLFVTMDDSTRNTNKPLREESIALARSMREQPPTPE